MFNLFFTPRIQNAQQTRGWPATACIKSWTRANFWQILCTGCGWSACNCKKLTLQYCSFSHTVIIVESDYLAPSMACVCTSCCLRAKTTGYCCASNTHSTCLESLALFYDESSAVAPDLWHTTTRRQFDCCHFERSFECWKHYCCLCHEWRRRAQNVLVYTPNDRNHQATWNQLQWCFAALLMAYREAWCSSGATQFQIGTNFSSTLLPKWLFLVQRSAGPGFCSTYWQCWKARDSSFQRYQCLEQCAGQLR